MCGGKFGYPAGRPEDLQAEVSTECPVEFGDERRWQLANSFANPLDRHGPDLLGLCFGVLAQPGLAGWEQDLEGVDPRGIRGHRHHRDDAASQPGRCGVGRVVADDDRRAGLAGFRSADRIEADGDDLTAAHSAAQSVGDDAFPCLGIVG